MTDERSRGGMSEANVQEGLVAAFDFLRDKVKVQRPRRIFADVPADKFKEVFDHAVKVLGFSTLCTITGLDDVRAFECIYHLANKGGIVLNLRITVPKERPVIETITRYFPGADIYERELADLLGIRVEGLAEGRRYPLPDDWPRDQYPLRKDWKPDEKKEIK